MLMIAFLQRVIAFLQLVSCFRDTARICENNWAKSEQNCNGVNRVYNSEPKGGCSRQHSELKTAKKAKQARIKQDYAGWLSKSQQHRCGREILYSRVW